MLGRRIENAPEVVDTRGAIDVEPELRQLERDVALDPRIDDRLDDAAVLARRGIRFSRGLDALAEVVERQEQAAGIKAADRGDRFFDGLAGDEPAREAALAHPVARGQPLQGVDLREGVEERFGRRRRASVRRTAGRQQVRDRAGVVAQHVALAHAEAAVLDHEDAARLERLGGEVDGVAPLVTARLAPTARSVSSSESIRPTRSARLIDGRIAAATSAVGSTL